LLNGSAEKLQQVLTIDSLSPFLAWYIMTIFGFNTDVKFEEVVYHVQSEARQADLLLQTMVFVKGQCVGKRTTSYAHKTMQPGFTEEATHELLKTQHKRMMDTIQQGDVANALTMTGEVEDIDGDGLSLKWIGPPAVLEESLALKLLVSDKGKAIPSAQVGVMHCGEAEASTILTTTTDQDGHADLTIPINGPTPEQALMVVAKLGERSVTRKLRTKK
jgi:hypothetical protein